MNIKEWGPISQYQMRAFLKSSQDDGYGREYDRSHASLECGLEDGPIQGITVSRGGVNPGEQYHPSMRKTAEQDVMEQIEMLKYVHSREDDFEKFQYPNEDEASKERVRVWDERCAKFVAASNDEIYVVFHEDCKPLDLPVISEAKRQYAKENENYGKISDEWNVLSNWEDNVPAFREVWDRRKVKLADAIVRIAEMKPLPAPPPPPPFAIDPVIMQEINGLVPKLVPIADENSAPHGLVVEQQSIKSELAEYYAILAAQKVMLKIGGIKPQHVNVHTGYKGYQLSMQQCQYDDWRGWYKFFQDNCQIDEWKNNSFEGFPTANWDFSNDPDFAHAEQKIYPLTISYYDSHESGY